MPLRIQLDQSLWHCSNMIGRSCEKTHILENFSIVIPGHECQWLPRSQPNSRVCNSRWLFCVGVQQEQEIQCSNAHFSPYFQWMTQTSSLMWMRTLRSPPKKLFRWSPNPFLKHITNSVLHVPVQPNSVFYKGDEIVHFLFLLKYTSP